MLLAIAVGGLSLGLMVEGHASRGAHERLDANLRALEAAETGAARAEAEIASLVDAGKNGVGNLASSFAGSSFDVKAERDPLHPRIWTIRSAGVSGLSTRRIEVSVERTATGPWNYALFAKDLVEFKSSKGMTDAYDSRLGSYAAQAVNRDSTGAYGLSDGSIGSNGRVRVKSSGVIHGDATAGPGRAPEISKKAVVTGEVDSLDAPLALPSVPFEVFEDASLHNDDGTWTVDGKLDWDPDAMELELHDGARLTLTGSTYFFSKLKLSSGSAVVVSGGPIRVYLTGETELSAESTVNATGRPHDLQFWAEPYALPAGRKPKKAKLSLTAGSGSAYTVYAPQLDVKLSGKGDLFGAIIAGTIECSGGASLHYDISLADTMGGPGKVHRLAWREPVPPHR